MSIENLLAGLNQFKSGIQQLQQGRLINKANEAVKQIRMSEADDAQKRAQLQQLSDQVALGIMQTGGTAQGSALAAQILAPKKRSPIQSLTQGLFSEDPEVRKRAESLQAEQAASEQAKIQREAQLEDRRAAQKFERDKELTKMKTMAKLRKDQRSRLIPGIGIALDPVDARRVRKELPQLDSAVDDIDRLITLADEVGAEGKLSPEARRRAKGIATGLRGKLRLALIGPGAMSDQEQATLQEVIANPLEILQVPGTAQAVLNELKIGITGAKKRQLEYILEERFDEDTQTPSHTVEAEAPKNGHTEPGKGVLDFRNFVK